MVIHRACALAQRNDFTGRILVATFNKALALDLKRKILSLGGKQLASKIDVKHVDSLASQYYLQSSVSNRDRAKPGQISELWTEAMAQVGEKADEFNPAFLNEEYEDVVLAGGLRERRDYLQAQRRGRGRKLSRAQRITVWDLTLRFETLLERAELTTWGKVAAVAANYAEEQAIDGTFPYSHILVDEAQDLNAQHWRMLRNSVPEGTNDLFLAADAHQRLYQKPLVLSSLGINIRGRSSRLKINYRTSREILTQTISLLEGSEYADFDDDIDTLAGYRSVVKGGKVEVIPHTRSSDELDALVQLVIDWRESDSDASIGVAAPNTGVIKEIRAALEAKDIPITTTQSPGTDADKPVCVDTMFQMKGLEFQYVACAGLNEAHFPPDHLRPVTGDDKVAVTRKLQQAQSLLFVTATRARDQLALLYSAKPTPILKQMQS